MKHEQIETVLSKVSDLLGEELFLEAASEDQSIETEFRLCLENQVINGLLSARSALYKLRSLA